MANRALCEIAADIRSAMGPKNKAPFLHRAEMDEALTAMSNIRGLTEMYGLSSGEEWAAQFLQFSGSWRHPSARQIRSELNSMVGKKYKIPERVL